MLTRQDWVSRAGYFEVGSLGPAVSPWGRGVTKAGGSAETSPGSTKEWRTQRGGGVSKRGQSKPPEPAEIAVKRNRGEGKACRKCGETKTSAHFPRNRRVKDGLSFWCRLCHNAAVRACKARKRALKGPSETLNGPSETPQTEGIQRHERLRRALQDSDSRSWAGVCCRRSRSACGPTRVTWVSRRSTSRERDGRWFVIHTKWGGPRQSW